VSVARSSPSAVAHRLRLSATRTCQSPHLAPCVAGRGARTEGRPLHLQGSPKDSRRAQATWSLRHGTPPSQIPLAILMWRPHPFSRFWDGAASRAYQIRLGSPLAQRISRDSHDDVGAGKDFSGRGDRKVRWPSLHIPEWYALRSYAVSLFSQGVTVQGKGEARSWGWPVKAVLCAWGCGEGEKRKRPVECHLLRGGVSCLVLSWRAAHSLFPVICHTACLTTCRDGVPLAEC